MGRKLTTTEFISKSKVKHNDFYSYGKTEYVSTNTLTIVTCPTHGDFMISPRNHLYRKVGCKDCFIDSRRLSTREFIEKSIKTNGSSYDYSKTKYINSRSKVKIICSKGHEFSQSPRSHLKGIGCPICSGLYRKSSEEFIRLARDVHGNAFDYSVSKYVNTKTKLEIICKTHGSFYTTAGSHLYQKTGCPKCTRSIGETEVSRFLNGLGIAYIEQWAAPKCKYISQLYFDFFLLGRRIVIEYDGIQHFEPVEAFGGKKEFKKVQNRDKCKDEWCSDNGYRLLRIPYFGDVDDFLRLNF